MDNSSNSILTKILYSINTYLLRNKGAVSDFNMVKDITDRNCDSLDEEINTLLPIPLYLGLMGTMLGIVIGLFFMKSISASDFEDSINILIGGVKIAMIASFIGLLLTVIASGYLYKGAKALSDSKKNDFFTFIQTELLPVLSNNTASIMRSFENVVHNFTEKFSHSTTDFVVSMKNMGSLSRDFRSMLAEIQNVNLVRLSKTNVELMKKIAVSAEEFERFNGYLHGVNEFTRYANELNHGISKQLERTIEIEKVAKSIAENTASNEKVMAFLSSDLNNMEERKRIMSDATIKVSANMDKAIQEMGEFLAQRIGNLKTSTIDLDKHFDELFKEVSLKFQTIFANEQGSLQDLSKLGQITETLQNLKDTATKQNINLELVASSLRDLNKTLLKQHSRNAVDVPMDIHEEVPVVPFWKTVPKPVAYTTAACIGSGAVIGTGFIIYTIVDWISLLF